ncbi:MAG: hypothetical protein DRP85_07065 [Candidatus Makaraimicrobium thalassicum]|nr:MAG: hypothetical protein DRP85_07065 [Candidatus Omnitrophota bacterium]
MEQKKILVVDDEKDTLTVLEERLANAGYLVITAENGRDAIDTAKDQQPDLILLDIIMPGMDGGVVARELKGCPETRDIPVIFLTCLFSKEDEREKGRVVGGNIFIAKPYTKEELLGEIKKFL